MTSYLSMLQQAFAILSPSQDIPAVNLTHIDPVANITSTDTQPFPTDLSSFIALLYSFSALRDWLKLIIIGGLFETCRRLVLTWYNKLVNSFFINASFDQGDASYNWILVWLAKQPSWSKTRDVQISTRSFGSNSPAVELDGEEESANQFFKSSRKISYLPSASLTYSLWYRRRWLTITRLQSQAGMYGEKENTLYISILTRDHKILTELLQEARRFYMAGQEHNMCVYVSDSGNHWNHVACRAKRSMRSIVLDPGIKDILLEDARDFLRSKSWYSERGIPFRRGYLLYGAPGSGKTSMIHCMAGELGLDVYIVSLSRAGLDDSSLSELVNALPERCVALMEDIDAAFTHGVSRGEITGPSTSDDDEKPAAGPGAASATTSKLSLSGLLNALDGVGAQEGRILFATTNKYSALDSALCRPGRMDLHVEFKDASKFQARELFNRFYLPTETAETFFGEDLDEKESVDSGYDSSESTASASAPGKPGIVEKNLEAVAKPSAIVTPTSDQPLLTGSMHMGRAPELSRARIAELAETFADAIPERECSMASLQGYLMTYKTRPVEAAQEAAAWVEKERLAKIKKESEKDKEVKKPAVVPVVASGKKEEKEKVVVPSTCTCGATSPAGLTLPPPLPVPKVEPPAMDAPAGSENDDTK